MPLAPATTCERALLNKLGGGCQVPIGAFAEVQNGRIRLMRWSRIQTAPRSCVKLAKEKIQSVSAKKSARSCCAAAEMSILEEVYGAGFAVPQQP